jgi:hypothetical protein
MLRGAFVPMGLVAYAGKAGAPAKPLSDGARLLYGLLSYHGGKTGKFPRALSLSREMGGASERTVSRYASELAAHGFLRVDPGHRGQPNEYIFLWHPCLAGSLRANPIPEDLEQPEPEPERSPNLATLNPQKDANSDYLSDGKVASFDAKGRQKKPERSPNLATAYKEEEKEENIKRSSSEPQKKEVQVALATEHDDDPNFSETENQNPGAREELIGAFQRMLRMSRAQSLRVPVEQVDAPDRLITIKILKLFSDFADAEKWIEGTVRRALGRKAKSALWGLWEEDARNQETQIRLDREAAEAGQALLQAKLVAREAAEAEAERVRHTPVPAGQAIDALAADADRRALNIRIPWALKAKLLRTNEYISPADLMNQAHNWQRCADCQNRGSVGSAIDRDLRWCICPASVEARYRDGDDWPGREIERVHASTKSLLVEACRRRSCDFTGDIVATADVVDDGKVVTVRPANPMDCKMITKRELRELLWQVRIEREVVVTA